MACDELIPPGTARPVAVLAHPDDESLWCAGLLSASELDWTVICCSIPPQDPTRAYKFFAACEMLGVLPRLLPYRETEVLDLALLDLSPFDLILTHGAAGEYGHRHHKQLHVFVGEHYPERARFIGYGGPGRFSLPLDDRLRARKMSALQCYDGGPRPPQWRHLLANYGRRFDLWTERYD